MPVPNTRRFNRYGADTGLDFSFGQIPVADHPLSAGIILKIAVLAEKKPIIRI